jgi:hypothetical protein
MAIRAADRSSHGSRNTVGTGIFIQVKKLPLPRAGVWDCYYRYLKSVNNKIFGKGGGSKEEGKKIRRGGGGDSIQTPFPPLFFPFFTPSTEKKGLRF